MSFLENVFLTKTAFDKNGREKLCALARNGFDADDFVVAKKYGRRMRPRVKSPQGIPFPISLTIAFLHCEAHLGCSG